VYPAQTITLNQGAGRSAYLCPDASCLQSAQKKNRLARCLKAAIPESIYTALWQQINQREFAGQEALATHPSESWQNG
jgi:hypothetical protein